MGTIQPNLACRPYMGMVLAHRKRTTFQMSVPACSLSLYSSDEPPVLPFPSPMVPAATMATPAPRQTPARVAHARAATLSPARPWTSATCQVKACAGRWRVHQPSTTCRVALPSLHRFAPFTAACAATTPGPPGRAGRDSHQARCPELLVLPFSASQPATLPASQPAPQMFLHVPACIPRVGLEQG